jgi:hypothetical protein
MADQRPRNFDPGTRLILEELRDLRLEMRADRRRADEERQEDRQRADEGRRRYDEERRRSDERFERMMQDFEQRSARREVATQRAFKDIRTVGLSIVKTLNHHTSMRARQMYMLERQAQILERIDRKLGVRGNGRPGHEDGGAPPRR